MEPGRAPRDSEHYGIRILEPILEVMKLDCRVLDSDAEVAEVAPAIERAYRESRPLVFLISRSPV